MSLEIDIQTTINANLPAQVGDVLKKRLEQAEMDAKLLEAVKAKLALVTDQRDAITKDREALSLRVAVLEQREADLVKREKAITALEMTAKFEKEKTELVLGMFGTVFQNRTVRETALVQRQSEYWQPGCPQPNKYPTEVPETRTVTES